MEVRSEVFEVGRKEVYDYASNSPLHGSAIASLEEERVPELKSVVAVRQVE